MQYSNAPPQQVVVKEKRSNKGCLAAWYVPLPTLGLAPDDTGIAWQLSAVAVLQKRAVSVVGMLKSQRHVGFSAQQVLQ